MTRRHLFRLTRKMVCPELLSNTWRAIPFSPRPGFSLFGRFIFWSLVIMPRLSHVPYHNGCLLSLLFREVVLSVSNPKLLVLLYLLRDFSCHHYRCDVLWKRNLGANLLIFQNGSPLYLHPVLVLHGELYHLTLCRSLWGSGCSRSYGTHSWNVFSFNSLRIHRQALNRHDDRNPDCGALLLYSVRDQFCLHNERNSAHAVCYFRSYNWRDNLSNWYKLDCGWIKRLQPWRSCNGSLNHLHRHHSYFPLHSDGGWGKGKKMIIPQKI